MKARLLIALLMVVAAVPAFGADAATDRIIVKWRTTEPAAAAAAGERVRDLGTRTGRTLRGSRPIGGGMSVIRLSGSQQGAALDATLAALRADPAVELAEPDRRVRHHAYVPNDPLFSAEMQFRGRRFAHQWYLRGDELAAIRADRAWEISRGGPTPESSIVVVAVLDSGIRPDHPDLAGKLLPGYDFVSLADIANDGDEWDTDPTDPGDFLTADELASPVFRDGKCGAGDAYDQPVPSSWHGTRVAGLIAAGTDNGIGMAGVGFNVRILPVRVLGKCGGFESDVIAGMYWAAGLVMPPPLLRDTRLPVNAHPAQILNMSLGSEGGCTRTYAAAVRDLTAHGVLVVASAGNEGKAAGSPAACEGVLAVSGIRHAGTKVGYSNLGPEVTIAAPAGNCLFVELNEPCAFALNTITNLGSQGPAAEGYSTPFIQPTYGTSFATPLVAGSAALLKSVNPALTPAQLIARIRETARPFPAASDSVPQPPVCTLPAEGLVQNEECICTTTVCGAGMLDAGAAVQAALRPAVLARVTGAVLPGRSVTLDGSQSAAATGRSIASYAWTVESTSGGAGTPRIDGATLPIASVLSPGRGSITLRLTVTDNLGDADAARVTITASGDASTDSPPPSGKSGGGGGSIWLPGLAALLLRRALARRSRLINS